MPAFVDDPRFRMLADSLAQFVWVSSADGDIVYLNQRWARYTGLSVEECRRDWTSLLHAEDRERTLAWWRRTLANGVASSAEGRIRVADGSYRWWKVDASPAFDVNGVIAFWFGTCADIHELKTSPGHAVATKNTLHAALESTGDAILICDAAGTATEFNEAFARFHRFKDTGSCFRTLAEYQATFEMLSPTGESVPWQEWPIVRALGGETASDVEMGLHRKDTGESWVASYNFAPIRNAEGEVVGAVCAARDITQQKELEELLQLQTRELLKALDTTESASRAKSAFLGTVSHELRSPLNAVIGFSGLLLDGTLGEISEQQRRAISIVRQSGQQLLELISELLDVANIEAGRIRVARSPVFLATIIAEQCDALRQQATARQLQLTNRMIDDDITVLGDRARIGQVVRNLIENAMKFTDQGSVDVRAGVCNGMARVEVEDTGIGIAADQQSKIFRRFERITGRSDKLRPGTGLGLDICKRIVEAMGGEIGVDSEPGRGSTFWFVLPLATHGCPAPTPATEDLHA